LSFPWWPQYWHICECFKIQILLFHAKGWIIIEEVLGVWTVVCTIQFHEQAQSNQVCNIFNFTVYWKFFRDCIFSLLTPVTNARLSLFRIHMLKIVQENRKIHNMAHLRSVRLCLFFGQQWYMQASNNVLQAKFSI
jgi:hypothetical protein